MTNFLNISCCPYNETPLVPVRPKEDYVPNMRRECRAFKAQLQRAFNDPPDSARFVVKSFPHDFGSYMEVCVEFDDDDKEAVEFAYKVESEAPQDWDDEAKEELADLIAQAEIEKQNSSQ